MNLPDMTLMGMDTKTWMISFGVAAGAFIILLLIRKFIGKRMAEIAGEINPETGKLLEGIIIGTGTYFLIAVSLYAGSMVLALPPGIASKLGIIVFLIFLLQVSKWGGWLIAYFVNKTIKKRKEEGTEDATVFALVKFFSEGRSGRYFYFSPSIIWGSISPPFSRDWESAELLLPLPRRKFLAICFPPSALSSTNHSWSGIS